MDAHETSIYTAIVITAIVLGTAFVYFIVSIISQQKKNQRLHKSKILAEVTTLEKERARLSADLHDEVGPILSSAKFTLSAIEISEKDQARADKVNQYLDEIITKIRETANDLMPTILKRKGFVPALESFIQKLGDRGDLKIYFSSNDDIPISDDRAVHLYRISQEVIHNTIKHAQATELKIELRKEKNYLLFTAEDNGIGFDYELKSEENSGLGLRNLLSRTEILGGKMFINSKKNKGSKYTFELPI